MREECLVCCFVSAFLGGLVVGIFMWVVHVEVYQTKLIELGAARYNPTTGKFEEAKPKVLDYTRQQPYEEGR